MRLSTLERSSKSPLISLSVNASGSASSTTSYSLRISAHVASERNVSGRVTVVFVRPLPLQSVSQVKQRRVRLIQPEMDIAQD